MRKEQMRRCRNFNCDTLHGHYCCADCKWKAGCKNPCLNDPSRCGLENKGPAKPSGQKERTTA